MKIVKHLIELFVTKQMVDCEKLVDQMALDSGSPIKDAANMVKNKPLADKIARKVVLLTFLKGL